MFLDLGCLIFARLQVLFRTSSLLFWMPGMPKSVLILVGKLVFRGGVHLALKGSLQLLSASHPEGKREGLLRGILAGGVWNGFLLEEVGGEVVPCRFCGKADGDGHLFWEMNRDRSTWPRCLLWHGWLPALAYPGRDPLGEF